MGSWSCHPDRLILPAAMWRGSIVGEPVAAHTRKVEHLFARRERLEDRLQRPLRDLRLSVTDRCNFRCPYCMPRERFHDQYRFLKSSERLDFNELLRLTRLFLQLGVVKLRVTGGEPLLRA